MKVSKMSVFEKSKLFTKDQKVFTKNPNECLRKKTQCKEIHESQRFTNSRITVNLSTLSLFCDS